MLTSSLRCIRSQDWISLWTGLLCVYCENHCNAPVSDAISLKVLAANWADYTADVQSSATLIWFNHHQLTWAAVQWTSVHCMWHLHPLRYNGPQSTVTSSSTAVQWTSVHCMWHLHPLWYNGPQSTVCDIFIHCRTMDLSPLYVTSSSTAVQWTSVHCMWHLHPLQYNGPQSTVCDIFILYVTSSSTAVQWTSVHCMWHLHPLRYNGPQSHIFIHCGTMDLSPLYVTSSSTVVKVHSPCVKPIPVSMNIENIFSLSVTLFFWCSV